MDSVAMIPLSPATSRVALTGCGRWLPSLLVAGVALGGCAVTPEPMTKGAIAERAQRDLTQLYAQQEPITDRVTLFEAMARALKYNLDQRVKLMEEAISSREVDLAEVSMLPRLTAAAGYTARNTLPGSTSRNLTTGLVSPDFSASTDRVHGNGDLVMAWNVLDFGVSYVQARQQSNLKLIAGEQRRKSVHNVLQDVRYAYWRAVAAEELMGETDQVLQEVEGALARSRKLEKSGDQPPLKSLEYQQALLDTLRQLWAARKEMIQAKTELSSLMNIKPGSDFKVEYTRQEELSAPAFQLPVQDLESFALLNRPELREEDYQERINALEVHKILLQMLPGLEVNLGGHLDTSHYVQRRSWGDAGVKFSLNMVNMILGAPRAVAVAEAKQELARTRRLAYSLAALTQLHLSMEAVRLASRDYNLARELNSVHARKSHLAAAAQEAEKGDEMTAIRSRVETLFARMQQGLAYAEMQGALGRFHTSLGVDPLPAAVDSDRLADLSEAIRQRQTVLPEVIRTGIQGPVAATVTVNPLEPQTARRVPSREGKSFIIGGPGKPGLGAPVEVGVDEEQSAATPAGHSHEEILAVAPPAASQQPEGDTGSGAALPEFSTEWILPVWEQFKGWFHADGPGSTHSGLRERIQSGGDFGGSGS